jgi:hypothetical protein
VPPGTYTLDVIDPGTHVLWERLPTVELTDPAACVSEDITLRYNGRIRGKRPLRQLAGSVSVADSVRPLRRRLRTNPGHQSRAM